MLQVLTSRWTRVLSLATLAAAVLIGTTSTAQAGHQSYRYTGPCYHFHGEEHIIHALEMLDGLAYADCHRDRAQLAGQVRQEILLAHRDVCEHGARRSLIRALVAVNRYVATGRPCDLDETASHLIAALDCERACHVPGGSIGRHGRPVPPPCLFPTQPAVYPHGGHHGPAYGNPYGRSQVQIGTGALRIGFSF